MKSVHMKLFQKIRFNFWRIHEFKLHIQWPKIQFFEILGHQTTQFLMRDMNNLTKISKFCELLSPGTQQIYKTLFIGD